MSRSSDKSDGKKEKEKAEGPLPWHVFAFARGSLGGTKESPKEFAVMNAKGMEAQFASHGLKASPLPMAAFVKKDSGPVAISLVMRGAWSCPLEHVLPPVADLFSLSKDSSAKESKDSEGVREMLDLVEEVASDFYKETDHDPPLADNPGETLLHTIASAAVTAVANSLKKPPKEPPSLNSSSSSASAHGKTASLRERRERRVEKGNPQEEERTQRLMDAARKRLLYERAEALERLRAGEQRNQKLDVAELCVYCQHHLLTEEKTVVTVCEARHEMRFHGSCHSQLPVDTTYLCYKCKKCVLRAEERAGPALRVLFRAHHAEDPRPDDEDEEDEEAEDPAAPEDAEDAGDSAPEKQAPKSEEEAPKSPRKEERVREKEGEGRGPVPASTSAVLVALEKPARTFGAPLPKSRRKGATAGGKKTVLHLAEFNRCVTARPSFAKLAAPNPHSANSSPSDRKLRKLRKRRGDATEGPLLPQAGGGAPRAPVQAPAPSTASPAAAPAPVFEPAGGTGAKEGAKEGAENPEPDCDGEAEGEAWRRAFDPDLFFGDAPKETPQVEGAKESEGKKENRKYGTPRRKTKLDPAAPPFRPREKAPPLSPPFRPRETAPPLSPPAPAPALSPLVRLLMAQAAATARALVFSAPVCLPL